jgi:hypothetical protein
MTKQILFALVLFVGAFFNAFVMPARIRRQVGDNGLAPKMGQRLCLLWYCWAAVFTGLGVVVLAKAFLGK